MSPNVKRIRANADRGWARFRPPLLLMLLLLLLLRSHSSRQDPLRLSGIFITSSRKYWGRACLFFCWFISSLARRDFLIVKVRFSVVQHLCEITLLSFQRSRSTFNAIVITKRKQHCRPLISERVDCKCRTWKWRTKYVGHKSAQPENAGHENAGHEIAGHEIAGQNSVRPTMKCVAISCLFLLFS